MRHVIDDALTSRRSTIAHAAASPARAMRTQLAIEAQRSSNARSTCCGERNSSSHDDDDDDDDGDDDDDQPTNGKGRSSDRRRPSRAREPTKTRSNGGGGGGVARRGACKRTRRAGPQPTLTTQSALLQTRAPCSAHRHRWVGDQPRSTTQTEPRHQYDCTLTLIGQLHRLLF